MGAARSGHAPSEADQFARRRAKCPTVPASHNSSVPNSQLLHTTPRTKRCRLPFPTIIYNIVFHESELFAPFFSERRGPLPLFIYHFYCACYNFNSICKKYVQYLYFKINLLKTRLIDLSNNINYIL